MDKGYIVIFAGGNGQPFVTTDYPAVQRALETHCGAIFAAKQGVNGVYTNDPKIDSKAKKYKTLNYNDVIKENIKVMDQSALILARDHHLPVHVFDFEQTNIMTLICQGKNKGTIVSDLATSFE